MRLGVLVLRRFVAKGSGPGRVMEVYRAAELAIPPVPGMVLAFGDGTGECVVSKVRHRIGAAVPFGILPAEVELIGCKEPVNGLEAALTAGWQRVPQEPGEPSLAGPGLRLG